LWIFYSKSIYGCIRSHLSRKLLISNTNVFFLDDVGQADKKIYFVDFVGQADLEIYFVPYQIQAAWLHIKAAPDALNVHV
jgi:hypothetical protein